MPKGPKRTTPRPRAKPEIAPAGTASDIPGRLAVAEETLRAIRNGEVDALVVEDESPGPQVFTLSSADRPYRMFVENMRDGAATVSDKGIVLYANRRLATMLSQPLQEIIGSPVAALIVHGDRPALRAISRRGAGGTAEIDLLAITGRRVPVRVNTTTLDVDSQGVLCLTFADLTQQNAQSREIDRLGRVQADRMRDLEFAQAALTQQATHDALTGLPNRGLLSDRIGQTLARAGRSKTSTGLIFVDLDGFKHINDTRGHAAGDSVLRQVAERLLAAVRPMDTVCRLGGDEFVVLLPALDTMSAAVDVAERVAAVIEPALKLDQGHLLMRASIGISVSRPTGPDGVLSTQQLLQQADTAMYYAKSLGGSRIELFDRETTPEILDPGGDTWIARIREALELERFVLHAQPIIELATGVIVQQELLLRMRDRDDQLIPPLSFLPTAERCGLIGEIDQWVIKQATKIARTGQPVAVNLSAMSAGDPQLLALIEREVRDHKTDPRRLVFEITETAVMRNMNRATRFAEDVVGLGCELALDDFGTGFASFTYLKRLPVKYLKIDIDFIRDVSRSSQDMSVVRAIVGLAGDFGQQTIAEGVEDENTAEVLRDLGVTYAQGYLFGRPSPVNDADRVRNSSFMANESN
jgi:diguanylate cyclase (GGDEF)-like protein/PAS domain S-box-containing protein